MLMVFHRVHRRKVMSVIAASAALFALAACTDTANEFNSAAAPRARAPGVPVSLVSLEGAPENVIARISSALQQQAARRDISIVGIDGNPRYRLRGYFSTQSSADGKSELSWAFDIFDAQKKRARRFSGEETLRSGGSAWSALSDPDIEKVAFKALDEIAEFLVATPEAVAARGAPGSQRAAGLLASE
jgi:hypothetical protein